MDRILHLWMFAAMAFVLACGGTQPDTNNSSSTTLQEAQKIVDAYAARMGVSLNAEEPPPASLDEVIHIFQKDDIARFDQAVAYLNGIQGGDALVLRASFEIYRAGMQLGIADFFSTVKARAESESAVLLSKKQQGSGLSAEEDAALSRNQSEAATYTELANAMTALARARLDTGMTLAENAVRQYPEKPEGYLAKAKVFQQRGEWKLYDEQIMQAERLLKGEARFGLQYQKAVEEWKRNASPDEATKMLTALHKAFPDYVRIQATLVLVQQSAEAMQPELLKLKEMSPRHPVVLLIGGAVQKESEISSAIRAAITPAAPKSETETVNP